METTNQKRARLLGEPFGTANSRLRKMLLFDMATRLDEVWCYRCSYRITKLEEFSIEHTIPWQGTENPRETFFNISKIRFSHLSCNAAAGIKIQKFKNGSTPPNKKVPPEGRAWCGIGQHFEVIEEFSKNEARWNGLSDSCIHHRKIYRKKK